MRDIVFPKNNEKEFISLAEKLGYNELIFVYDQKNLKKQIFKTKIKIIFGVKTNPKQIQKARNKSDFVIVEADEHSRMAFENKHVSLIYALEKLEKHDHMHFRKSGLNQVLCSLACKKDIIVGFSFNSILNSSEKWRSRLLGRMMQNVKLCRKYKVKTTIASFATKPMEMRSPAELKSFGIILGMHAKKARESLH